MKRFRKVLLALAALLGVVVVAGIWLINSALNVASDVVDSTFGGAQKVQAVAQKEVVVPAQSAPNGTKAPSAGVEPSSDVTDKPAPALTTQAAAAPPADKSPEKTADKDTGSAPKPSEAKEPKGETDSLADIGDLLSLFFNDGDDASELPGLLTAGDKDAKEDKSGGKKTEDSLTDMIPGANSPTVKGWMAGKYKGKEAQALDDALEDPKIWRLVFFLSGGM